MKLNRWIVPALTMAVISAGPLAAQDDPYVALRSYDSQKRTAIVAIQKQIAEAGADRARLAAIEKQLAAVIADTAAGLPGKQEAASLLTTFGTAVSVPALATLLSDEKGADAARLALERLSDPAAAKALRVAARRTKGRALVGIVNSMGNRRDPEAVGLLAELSKSAEPLVAEAAVAALGRIPTLASLTALAGVKGNDAAAGQSTVRVAAALAASGRRAPAEKALLALAGPRMSPVVRCAALRGLAAAGSPRTLAVALAQAVDPEAYLHAPAGRVLGALADPVTTTKVIFAFPGLTPAAQVALLTAMADRRETTAARLALKATESPSPEVRAAAIRTAALVGGASSVPRLAELAAKGEERTVARTALAGMPGEGAEKALLGLTASGTAEVRAALMGILAERPNPAAVTAIMTAAHGVDVTVAAEALKAAGRVAGQPQIAEIVALVVSSGDEGVRDAARDAAVAIAQRTGQREAGASAVIAVYGAAPVPAQVALLGALADLGGRAALECIVAASSSASAEVKQAAVTGLADTWADPSALPSLLNIASGDKQRAIQAQALRGYFRLLAQDDRAPVEERVEAVKAGVHVAFRPDEKRQALGILRDCRTDASIDLAGEMLADSDLFVDAADTVLYLAEKQRKGDRDLPAVRCLATDRWLNAIIEKSQDEAVKERARKLK